ncbi:hypothetical protein LYSBPC_04620 [Lysinibacillus piscis]|uniref:Uncharacterized protein n=1 Tax=Lysinibacillus piscis TaxID=2518931 RepID=A0ABQ5NGD4_9BACI|nr:hypothetical protein LYSBPC_04620 [Lysinibacillus sp. KH24]
MNDKLIDERFLTMTFPVLIYLDSVGVMDFEGLHDVGQLAHVTGCDAFRLTSSYE